MSKRITVTLASLKGQSKSKMGQPRSHTLRLARTFTEGAEAGGAHVETIALASKRITSCNGAKDCWDKPDRGCTIKNDDMPDIIESIFSSDIWVIATPVYNYNISSLLQRLFERMIVCLSPLVVLDDAGWLRHPFTSARRPEHIVFVSTCGLPGMENFDVLRSFGRTACAVMTPNLLEIFLPMADVFYMEGSQAVESNQNFARYLEAVHEAGRALATDRPLDGAVRKRLRKGPRTPRSSFIDIANEHCEALGWRWPEEAMTPKATTLYRSAIPDAEPD